MTLNLAPDWRRTVLALTFAGAGMALTAFAFVDILIVWRGDWPASLAAQRLEIIGHSNVMAMAGLGLVLIGLAMTVSLRQVSGKFMGNSFDAIGGGSDAPVATVTTTTAVTAPGVAVTGDAS